MDVLETQQLSERTIEKVIVHPLVLRIIADQYKRVAKNTSKRVVGVLLGRSSRGIVDVTNCYPVLFEEDGKDPCSWSIDQIHHRSMLNVFKGINDMVGWYSTGPELRGNDLDVHTQFCGYAPNPVLVIIDVQPQGLGIPTKAYYAIEEEERNQKVFVPASVEIAHEIEEVGVEPLLNDLKDTATDIATRPLALDGVSSLDATESFMEYYKKQVRISVEGYDLSISPVDLDISLEKHFSSCGEVEFVEVPRDPMTNAVSSRFTTVLLRGEGAEEKALALNGSDVGGWRVSVKVLPPALSSLRPGLSTRESARLYLAHFRRYKSRGITVKGYDYSLCEADVKSALVNHFSSCGEITDVFVLKRRALVYFFGNCAVGKALKHCRSQKRVTGFRARPMPIPKRIVVAGSDAYIPYTPVS